MKGQHDQDPEAGAGLAPEGAQCGSRGPSAQGTMSFILRPLGGTENKQPNSGAPGNRSRGPGAPSPKLLLGAQRQEPRPQIPASSQEEPGPRDGHPRVRVSVEKPPVSPPCGC